MYFYFTLIIKKKYLSLIMEECDYEITEYTLQLFPHILIDSHCYISLRNYVYFLYQIMTIYEILVLLKTGGGNVFSIIKAISLIKQRRNLANILSVGDVRNENVRY